MKREQEIRDRYHCDAAYNCRECTDIAWLLSELARLRTEAHQIHDEAGHHLSPQEAQEFDAMKGPTVPITLRAVGPAGHGRGG